MITQNERIGMVDKDIVNLTVSTQCQLLSVPKSSYYYEPRKESDENLAIMRLLDEQYYSTPFYGVLRLQALLLKKGYPANEKRVRRLMELVNWQTIYREPKTTVSDKTHYKYPYLLRGLDVNRNNQVWATDTTYIPMNKGFMYLSAIIDLNSRYVVNWSLSNTMSAEWCTELVLEAIKNHGIPEIINTDQGSQYTSEIFINMLKESSIAISMDGRGRALDNIFIERLWRSVKYENVYLNVYENGLSLFSGLKAYFDFYNNERLHQSLDYQTPQNKYIVAD